MIILKNNLLQAILPIQNTLTMNQTNKSPQQLKSELTLLKVITISISAVLFLLLAIVIYGMLTKPENKTFIALLDKVKKSK